MILADKIVSLRKRAGWSQEDLAEKLGAMEQLLEEGDYTRGQKKHNKVLSTVTTIYWPAVTAVFLVYTYGPSGNGQPRYSWVIWAVAGVLYAAVMGVVRLLLRSRKDQ